MKRSELKNMTRRELYEMAKAYDIPGRSKMAKDDLLDSLARISARKVLPKPKPRKRRMAKRRKRRRVQVRQTRASRRVPGSTTVVKRIEAAPEAPPALFVDRGPELPHEYGLDGITAMVRDPNWVFAYWDLSGGARDQLSARAGGGTWILRVHDLTEGVSEDVPILLEGGNWYLPVAADTEYQIDIGLLDRDGNFHLAASSRKVRTPPIGISERADEEWMILEDELKRLIDLSGAASERFAGSRFLSEIVSRRRAAGVMHSAGVSSFSRSRRR